MRTHKVFSKFFHPKPKPKPKGKRKNLRFQKHQDRDNMDVFKVVFGADSGGNSSPQSNKSYMKRARDLLKSTLTLLQKKVQRIQRRLLAPKEDRNEKNRNSLKNFDEAAKRVDVSMREEAELYLKIRNKLERLSISEVSRGKVGKIKGVHVDGAYMSILRLTKNYFSSECVTASKLLEEGTLVHLRSGQRPVCLVEKAILCYLEEAI